MPFTGRFIARTDIRDIVLSISGDEWTATMSIRTHRDRLRALARALAVAVVLCVVGTCSLTWAPRAAAAEETVRIGYFESRNFTEGAADDKTKDGYGYEYLQRIAGYAGWRYEYVYGTWDELYRDLCDGTIDMLPGVSRTAEHADQVLFPDDSMLSETFYIYEKDSNAVSARDVEGQLAGKRIGVVAGTNSMDAFDTWKARENVSVETYTYRTFDDMHAALDAGLIDAFVSSDNVAHGADDVVPVQIVGTEPYYLAVAPGKPELLGQLNSTLQVMDTQDRVFLDQLQNRYTADSAVNVYLYPDEVRWMSSHHSLTIGYLDDYLPYCDKTDDGDADGLLMDVVAQLLDGLPGSWAPHIKTRAYKSQDALITALKAGKVDVAFPVSGNAALAEERGYLCSSSVVSPTMDLVLKKGTSYDDAVKKVAVNRNNLMQLTYVKSALGASCKIVECDSVEDCLAAVKTGRAGSTVINGLRVGALLDSEDGLDRIQLPEEDARCFGVATGNGVLLRLLNRGLGMIGEDYGTNAASRYVAGLYRYTVNDFIDDNLPAIVGAAVLVLVLVTAVGIRHIRKLRVETAHEAQQNQRLEDALERAERASRAKDVMIANLSHDIRTPLNGILGIMDINARSDDPQEIQENTRRARTAARQLLGLVDDLLELAKLRSGDVEVGQEVFSLAKVFDEVLEELEPQAKDADVELRYACHSAGLDAMWVHGSPTYVRQVFVNVLDNAVRYNRRGGHVVWSCGMTGGADGSAVLTCSIEDDGIGMSPEFLEHLFEPFQQERMDARTVYPGSGLGLTIVKALVELMGGTIDVSSELDRGTTVVVSIPFAVAEEPEPVTVRVPAEKDLMGMRILLAEDNDLNRDITRYMLERAGVEEVVCTRDGAEAVRLFRESAEDSIDAILMDVMMPVMDGCEAARAIRALDRSDAKTVPIIAVTARAFADDRAEVLEAGMNEHLPKPLDAEMLVSVLARYR